MWDRVKHKTNSQIVNYMLKMPVTCVFDYTKTDHTLEDIAQVFGITREMVRQNEEKALRKIRHVKTKRDELVDYIDHENRHPIDTSIYSTFDLDLTNDL